MREIFPVKFEYKDQKALFNAKCFKFHKAVPLI